MRKKISIITPFYNEEVGIDLFFNEIVPILEGMANYDYELVCVDDGSKDATFTNLKSWHEKNKKIKVYKLSRNFGKEMALSCGLDKATGDVVIPMDCDLQHPPKYLIEMISKWEEGYKVVLMKRKLRNEGILKKLTAKLFYKLMNKISDSTIHDDVGDFRLLDKQVVESIKLIKEKNRFMKGILSWPGFSSISLEFSQEERKFGKAKQNYQKLLKLAFDGIFAFSSFPLRLWVYIGSLISIASFVYGLFVIYQKLSNQIDIPGYATPVVLILFLGGIQLISIGIVGEYIARIFNEVKNRPLYIIEEELV